MKFNRLRKSLIPISLVAAQAVFGGECVVQNGTGDGNTYKEIYDEAPSCTISTGFLDGIDTNLQLRMIIAEVSTASSGITIENPLYMLPIDESSTLNINHTDFQTSAIDVDDDTATININADFTTGGEIGKNDLPGGVGGGTLTINVDEVTFSARHDIKAVQSKIENKRLVSCNKS